VREERVDSIRLAAVVVPDVEDDRNLLRGK
jgi:hypothetical protein